MIKTIRFSYYIPEFSFLSSQPEWEKAMSLTLGRPAVSRVVGLPLARIWRGIRARCTGLATAQRLKRELATMDARMLSDLGVSRAQLRFEIEEWERARH